MKINVAVIIGLCLFTVWVMHPWTALVIGRSIFTFMIGLIVGYLVAKTD